MGTWGSGLYDNDTTCDIRDIYISFLEEELGNQEAYDKLMEQCSDYLQDSDDAPLFWFALAETQWSFGKLMPEVKTKAIEWIEKGGGTVLWGKSDSGGWKITLDELKAKLETPMPKEREINKPTDESFSHNRSDSLTELSQDEVPKYYFAGIGGFPSGENILRELKDYKGEEQLCVACTQLPDLVTAEICGVKGYSEQDRRRILKEWINFLSTNTKAVKALHFNTSVPQALFKAACCQENLVELRFKWGSYSDLSPLENLKHLKYLYLGEAVKVKDITVLGKLESLVVVYIEGFKKVEDYSPLATLCNLEQLVLINGSIKDVEFLREIPSLRSLLISGDRIKKKYTREELDNLLSALPNMHVYGDYLYKCLS